MNPTDDTSDQPKMQKRRAAVVIGRFNPPTIGHYAVFDQVKKFIRDHEDLQLNAMPVVVIVEGKETSKDKTKNPLTGEERLSFMKGSGRADGVKFLIAPNAMDAFKACRSAGYEPIAVAAGSDRADKYLEMLDKYFVTPKGQPIDHYAIELPREEEGTLDGQNAETKTQSLDDVLQYTDEEIPVSMVSGSLARHAVTRDALDKFSIITGLSAKPKLAALMFNKIKASMATMETPDAE